MNILAILDSEHYTDPEYVKFGRTKLADIRAYAEEEARNYMKWEKGRDASKNCTIKWSDNGRRLDAAYGDYFVVMEIKKVEDADYIIGYHHAYDGVEFDIKTAPSIEAARQIAKKEAEELKEKIDIASEDTSNINQIIMDDGNQWHMWCTYLIHETSLKACA